jgi:NTE family protein
MNYQSSKREGGKQAKVAIALGSGAARGWSHIGVLQGLISLGIQPEIIAGSSIGALVGAAYAADEIDRLEAWTRALEWRGILKYLDPTLLGGGLIEGEKLSQLMRQYVQDLTFEDLSRRLGVVATELDTGREIWFQQGPVIEAVRASIGLPGLFTPLKYDGRWLVDGGLTNPVPVSLCRAMGAEVVIAVNLNGDILGRYFRNSKASEGEDESEGKADRLGRLTDQLKSSFNLRKEELLSRLFGRSRGNPGLYEVLASSINVMQDRITRSRMAGDPPDIIITPRLSRFGLLEFDRADEAIDEGRAAVERVRHALEALILDK